MLQQSGLAPAKMFGDATYGAIEAFGPNGSRTSRPFDERERSIVRQYPDRYEKLRRKLYIEHFGWGVPTREVISAIRSFAGGDDILEIAAGYGLWAHLLQQAGASIRPTDAGRYSHESPFAPTGELYTAVECLEHIDALEAYPDHPVLLLIWPPECEAVGTESTWLFQGDRVIAGMDFSFPSGKAFLRSLHLRFSLERQMQLPSWGEHQDLLTFWSRR